MIRSPRAMMLFLAAVALSLLVFALNGVLGVVAPSSTWGIWYGVFATGLLLAAMAYAGRRRRMNIRKLGPSRTYLLVHIYGGTLFLLLQLMHSGFRLPDGLLTWSLWLLSAWVVLTGVLGVVMQKWLAVMLNQLRTEVQLSRIPALVAEIQGRAEEVCDEAGTVVRDLFTAELQPALVHPTFSWRSFGGFVDDKANRFDFVRTLVPSERHPQLDELRGLVRTKAEIDVHYALQTVLRRWLWLHIPAAVLLCGLIVLHIFVVIYY
ncbi:MAG: hypothetical protein ACR2QM_01260 [Longimicrobiales bacterium]